MRLAPPDILASRFDRLRKTLADLRLDALIVTSLPNIAYLTGFFGSAGLALVTAEDIRLISDMRYDAVVRRRRDVWPTIAPVIVTSTLSYEEALIQELDRFTGRRVGFEESNLTVRRHRVLSARPSAAPRPELVATDGLVEELRTVKDPWELGIIRDAATRLSKVAKGILPKALEGLTERDVAARLDSELRHIGFERLAFDTIVASGPNAALPHYRPGDRRIESGDLVLMDFGGVLDGYTVDLTRTVSVGPGDRRRQRVLEAVAAAQAAAMDRVAPGAAPEAIDGEARRVLSDAGYGEAFTHGTGHGLGLEVHERPRIGQARKAGPEPPLTADMVFTIEPGAYFPGWGGVRIEDDVRVTTSGSERLTDVPVIL